MKRAGGFFLLVVSGLALLVRSADAQIPARNFGSVVFPGGTSATSPFITRNFGSVVFPGGSPTSPPVRVGPGTVVPPLAPSFPGALSGTPFPFVTNSFGVSGNRSNGNNGVGRPINGGNRGGGNRGGGRRDQPTIFAYPVVVGGYGGGGYYDDPSAYGPSPMVPPPAQAAVPMMYPPQQETRPMIIQVGPDGQFTTQRQPPPQAYQQAAPAPPDQAPSEAPHFLIAFKDHTVYSAVAYWFDGDTLHYFTNGSTHNQASVSLIDRDLTERLNREMGLDFRMPALK
jgi:hypothetical protein